MGVGPEDEGLILLAKSVASCESDIADWFESSPIALTGVSDLKMEKIKKWNIPSFNYQLSD